MRSTPSCRAAWSALAALLPLTLLAAAAPARGAYLESDYGPQSEPRIFPPPRPVPPPPPIDRIPPVRNELQVLVDRIRVGMPVTYRGMTVFPLHTTWRRAAAAALTLHEARARGLVDLLETGAGVVGRVEMLNRGARFVLIVEGETLAGGYQDRVAAESVLLAPHQRALIPVYCIERGRWQTGAAKGLVPMSALAPPAVRRSLAEAASQNRVWRKIDEELAARGAAGRTSKLADCFKTPAFRREIDGYRGRLLRCVSRQTAGVAVAIHGRLIGIELFDEGRIAALLWPRLLESYAAHDIVLWGRSPVRFRPRQSAHHVYNALRRAAASVTGRRPGAAAGEILTIARGAVRGRVLAYAGACIHASVHVDNVVIRPPRPVPMHRTPAPPRGR